MKSGRNGRKSKPIRMNSQIHIRINIHNGIWSSILLRIAVATSYDTRNAYSGCSYVCLEDWINNCLCFWIWFWIVGSIINAASIIFNSVFVYSNVAVPDCTVRTNGNHGNCMQSIVCIQCLSSCNEISFFISLLAAQCLPHQCSERSASSGN